MVRVGQRLGKYRIRKRLAVGGFAEVFRATDTVEGVDIALKIPLTKDMSPRALDDFKHEIRLASRLQHPNILGLKNADYVDNTFMIAYPLGDESLDDRLRRRMSLATALDMGEQLIAALAFAHDAGVIHCDVKPANVILFSDGRLRLTDFGLAKISARTIAGSASGTVGFMAPEQALGRPSARSDVFSAALVLFRLFGGQVPNWPFDWPPPGAERIFRVAPALCPVLEKALAVDTRARYRNCGAMLTAYRAAKRVTLRRKTNGATRVSGNAVKKPAGSKVADWRSIRVRQLRRKLAGTLDLRHSCGACHQPVDERMHTCPWCGVSPPASPEASSFPAACPRCERGVKLDWHYCAWCYGAKIGPASDATYTDRRYTSSCAGCRGKLIPHSRYCPWCRAKVRKKWRLCAEAKSCGKCGHDVMPQFWGHCPWCGVTLPS